MGSRNSRTQTWRSGARRSRNNFGTGTASEPIRRAVRKNGAPCVSLGAGGTGAVRGIVDMKGIANDSEEI